MTGLVTASMHALHNSDLQNSDFGQFLIWPHSLLGYEQFKPYDGLSFKSTAMCHEALTACTVWSKLDKWKMQGEEQKRSFFPVCLQYRMMSIYVIKVDKLQHLAGIKQQTEELIICIFELR